MIMPAFFALLLKAEAMSDGIETGITTNEPFGHFVYWAVTRYPKTENATVDEVIKKEFPNRHLAKGGKGTYQPIPLHRSYAKNQPLRLGIKTPLHANEIYARIQTKMQLPASDKAIILSWNPDVWNWPENIDVVEQTRSGISIDQHWSTGNTKTLNPGQRVFLYRQINFRGIVGSGRTTSGVFEGPDYENPNVPKRYVHVNFDCILNEKDVLPAEALIARFPSFNWKRIQASGISIPSEIALPLESLWRDHLRSLGFVVELTELGSPAVYYEGSTKVVAVNAYERNPHARAACLSHHGYSCVVCGFDFVSTYGEIGEGFIHVHHLKDIATIGVEYEVNPIKDLRPVCPNCHAMLHTQTPAMSIDQLRSILKSHRA